MIQRAYRSYLGQMKNASHDFTAVVLSCKVIFSNPSG